MFITILAALLSTTITGKVVGITDGDTITVLVNKREVKVRLAEIDAPESGQPFGQRAKQALSGKVFGKDVRVESLEKLDRYERTVGTIFLGTENVNAWMVKEGWAWRYDRYSKSNTLKMAQDEAKLERKGLWADERPIEPWEWRANKRKSSSVRSKPRSNTQRAPASEAR